MSYVSIILGLLKLAESLFSYFQQRKWINEGEAIAVAKASAEIMRKTAYAKHALEEFTAKSDADVDEFLRNLEPGGRSEPGK